MATNFNNLDLSKYGLTYDKKSKTFESQEDKTKDTWDWRSKSGDELIKDARFIETLKEYYGTGSDYSSGKDAGIGFFDIDDDDDLINTFLMDSESTEMIKYIANCFFAVKVSYFNEVKLLCDKMDIDYDQVMGGVLSDGRIGVSHFEVPGHDGKPGFGGTCFPKDINSFINLGEFFISSITINI